MAKLHLHYHTALLDEKNTQVFGFSLESPGALDHREVKSVEFEYGGHRWFASVKRYEESLAVYNNITSSIPRTVTVYVSYGIRILNKEPHDNALWRSGKPREFMQPDAAGWGWNKTLNIKQILSYTEGFLFDDDKIRIELEIHSAKTVFCEPMDFFRIASEEPPSSGMYSTGFKAGGLEWNMEVYPDGISDESKGNVSMYLCQTGAEQRVDVTFIFLLNDAKDKPMERTFLPGSDSGWGRQQAFLNDTTLLRSQEVLIGVEILSLQPIYEIPFTPQKTNLSFIDVSRRQWFVMVTKEGYLEISVAPGVHYQGYRCHFAWECILVSQKEGVENVRIGPLISCYTDRFRGADTFQKQTGISREQINEGFTKASGEVVLLVNILYYHSFPDVLWTELDTDRDRREHGLVRKELDVTRTRLEKLEQGSVIIRSKNVGSVNDGSSTTLGTDIGEQHLAPATDSEQLIAAKSFVKNLLQGYTEAVFPSDSRHVIPYDPINEKRAFEVYKQYKKDLDFHKVHDEARPELSHLQRYRDLATAVISFVQMKMPLRVTKTIRGGSLGHCTSVKGHPDVELVFFSTDLPKNGHKKWLTGVLQALKNIMDKGIKYGELPKCSGLRVTPYALTFQCEGLHLEVRLTYDWESDGYEKLYEECMASNDEAEKKWLNIAATKRSRNFAGNQQDEVHDMIRVVKHWRNCVKWNKVEHRPTDYLLTLLVIKAHDSVKKESSAPKGSSSLQGQVLKEYIHLVTSSGSSPPLSIHWSTYYNPEQPEYRHKEGSILIQDPANPAYNVAKDISSWNEFRSLTKTWGKKLGI